QPQSKVREAKESDNRGRQQGLTQNIGRGFGVDEEDACFGKALSDARKHPVIIQRVVSPWADQEPRREHQRHPQQPGRFVEEGDNSLDASSGQAFRYPSIWRSVNARRSEAAAPFAQYWYQLAVCFTASWKFHRGDHPSRMRAFSTLRRRERDSCGGLASARCSQRPLPHAVTSASASCPTGLADSTSGPKFHAS